MGRNTYVLRVCIHLLILLPLGGICERLDARRII